MHRKNRANQLLAGVCIAFLMAVVLKMYFRESFAVQFLLAITQAAVVGGIADWFAVTALFREPCGFAWHTALIPRNRAKLVAGMAHMVQNELLSAEVIKQRVKMVSFVGIVIDWVDHKNGKIVFAEILAKHTKELMKTIDVPALASYMEGILKSASKQLQITPLIQHSAQWVLQKRKDEFLIEYVLGELLIIVAKDSTREAIYHFIKEYEKPQEEESFWGSLKNFGKKLLFSSAEMLDAYNPAEAATVLQQELVVVLQELKEAKHPLRLWLTARVRAVVEELPSNKAWVESLETWKEEVIERMELKEILFQFITLTLDSIQKTRDTYTSELQGGAVSTQQSPLMAWILLQVARYWDDFKTNENLKAWVEGYLQEMVCRIVESEHDVIGSLVGEALNRLTDEELNQFVEEKVGEDLQWVRINGSVVGALVGCALFLYLHFIHYPIIVPTVRQVFL